MAAETMQHAHYVYLLRCADKTFYVGCTDDLNGRLAEHQQGKGVGLTAKRLPATLAWRRAFPTRALARAAERQVKQWNRAQKEALIGGDFRLVKLLDGGG